MTLSPRNQAKIQTLARADVVATLGGLGSFLEAGAWIGKRNRYARNTISTLQSDFASGTIHSKQLSQYIAASTLLHCSDGWSYLGAAISCLLHGDPHRTRHLAYYAELRAAMSLLAASGVGVFSNTHFVIDGRDSATPLPAKCGTHPFVWDCVEFFANQNTLGELFASTMKPGGRSLGDWLAPIGGTTTIAPQAREWFLQWGIDLHMPEKDHYARNESSYRPDGFPTAWYLNAPEVLSFVRDLWSALEPAPNSHFDVVDRHILRLAVERCYRAQFGKTRSRKRPKYEAIVNQIVSHQAFGAHASQGWTDFLLRQVSPNDHVVLAASRLPPAVREGSDIAIVSRAMLLLRAASGSAFHLFHQASIDMKSVDFWRNGLGLGHGLWEAGGSNLDATDLWADVEALLSDLEMFQDRTPSTNQSFFRIGIELGRPISGLSRGERVAIWSMSA